MIWRITLIVLLVFILTVITQVGGVVLLLSMLSYPIISKRLQGKLKLILAKLLVFVSLYLFASLIIVPTVAGYFGRVPLPVFESANLRPLNFFTCVLNRHYVRRELREAVIGSANKLYKKFPGTKVNYLDANFPFINKFPLFPHLSHHDGKKLDLAFLYLKANTQERTNLHPSIIGYGVCESPRNNEYDMAEVCESKGYWQYSLLQKLVSQANKNKFEFDVERTRELMVTLLEQKVVAKIFIEPHLKTRLGLESSKIRFHGCQAVRHDDHIHIQLK